MESHYDNNVYATFIKTSNSFKSAICVQCEERRDNIQFDSFDSKKVIDLNTTCCISSLFVADCYEKDEYSFENVKRTYENLKNEQSLFRKKLITNTDVLKEIKKQIKNEQKKFFLELFQNLRTVFIIQFFF